MKKKAYLAITIAAVVALGCILLPASLAVSPATAATNIVLNPGFEEPDTGVNQPPSSWTASTSAPYRDDVPDTHSGNYSAYLHGTTGSYQQVVSIGASAVYRFEVYTRANAYGTDIVKLQIRDSSQNVLEDGNFTWTASDHGWLLRSRYINTPINAWDAVITLSISGTASAEAWFDDVILEQKLATDCFIATAAYDSGLAGQVDALRSFRDSYLSSNRVGTGFVSTYYSNSPPVAQFLDEHPAIKPMARAGLMPSVLVSSMAVKTSPGGKIAVSLLTSLLAVIAVAAVRLRFAAERTQ